MQQSAALSGYVNDENLQVLGFSQFFSVNLPLVSHSLTHLTKAFLCIAFLLETALKTSTPRTHSA